MAIALNTDDGQLELTTVDVAIRAAAGKTVLITSAQK